MSSESKVVLASGVFDIIHPGHLYYLRQSKSLGDKLVVVVTSDKTAKKQGKKTLFSQTERQALISSLAFVDKVMIGREGQTLESVLEINPDIVALGYDQWHNVNDLKHKLSALGFTGEIVRIKQYRNYSSSSYGSSKRH